MVREEKPFLFKPYDCPTVFYDEYLWGMFSVVTVATLPWPFNWAYVST